jgi:hypothetical protein
MPTLTSIDPTISKRTGGIPFTLTGTGFNTTDLTNDFSGGSFYTDVSSGGGSITDTTKLELNVDTTAGAFAGIDVTSTFDRSFNVSISTEYDITTFPSVNDTKIIGLRALNNIDATTYFQIYLGYKDPGEYFLKVEAVISGSNVYSYQTMIDPNNVEGLQIVRSEERMTAYIKISGEFAKIGDYLGFSNFVSRIRIFTENAPTATVSAFSTFVTEFKVDYVVSLLNAPAEILTVSDTEITGLTGPNDPQGEDPPPGIYVGFPDSTYASLAGFEYTESQSLAKDTGDFDTIISVYNFYIQPSRNELFTSAGNFVWDDNYWVDPDKQNKNLYTPSLWDPTTANVPVAFLQSGYGYDQNTKLIDIKKYRAESSESWHARLNHGTYFIRNVPYYLYSSESVTIQLGEEQTTDGRSKQHLKFPPKVGVPISASTLTVDLVSGLIVDNKRFNKRGKFTGTITNGIELDTSVVANIDKTKTEFIVNYNSNNKRVNWRIPTTGTAAGSYTFTLPEVPLKCYSVNFSRIDLFSSEKQKGFLYQNASEVTDFDTPVETSLDGKYFLLDAPVGGFYVWYDLDASGVADPAPVGRTGIQVLVVTGDGASGVATKTAAAINGNANFNSSASTATVTVTNIEEGAVDDLVDVDAGITNITVTNQGTDDLQTIYGTALYGEPLENTGDYSIDFTTGQVEVLLDQAYIDLGFVSYTFDYPAEIEFNDDYLTDKGVSITNPTSSDLSQLDIVGESDGSGSQSFTLSEFPILDLSGSEFLDTDNFNLFLFDESDLTFETDWVRVKRITEHGPSDKVYQLNPDQGTIFFGNGISGAIPTKYKKIVVGYKTSVRIEYEPESSADYWVGRDTDLNLSRNSLNSGFLYLSRKELIPDNISISFSVDAITALDFAELSAIVRDKDGDPVPSVDLTFNIVNGNGDLDEETLTTDSNGAAKTVFIPSGQIVDMGIFVYLYEAGDDAETLGVARPNIYVDNEGIVNSIVIAEEDVIDPPEEVFLFKVYDDGDAFNVYDNQNRTGGSYIVFHEYDSGTMQNELIRPQSINGKVLIFNQSLPQPFNPAEPNYEPNLRGFAIIGKKQVQAQATVVAGLITINSDIATLKVDYSPIQEGEWTLPIPPTEYGGSEIDRATYLTINPENHTLSFTQSGDTDTITLAHSDVEAVTIDVQVNGATYEGWSFSDNTGGSGEDEITWPTNIIKDGDAVVVTYTRETI